MRLEELSGSRVSRSAVTKVGSMPGSEQTWDISTSEQPGHVFLGMAVQGGLYI